MYQLMPLHQSTVGQTTTQTVNARDIYAYLEVKSDFSDWIKRRIDTYGFLQDIDFVKFLKSEAGTISPIEYHVTLDMAKQLAMVERTEKGKEARKYFIECERIAQTVQPRIQDPIQRADIENLLPVEVAHRQLLTWLTMSERLGTPLHIAQIEAVKAIEKTTGVDLKPLLLHAPAQRNIPDEAVMLEPTQLARSLKLKDGHAMNLALEALGWQVRDDGGEWIPTTVGAPHAIRNSWTSKHSNKSGYNLRWNRAAVAEALQHQRKVEVE